MSRLVGEKFRKTKTENMSYFFVSSQFPHFSFIFSGTKQKLKREKNKFRENNYFVGDYCQIWMKSKAQFENNHAQFTGRSVVVCCLHRRCVAVGICHCHRLRHLSVFPFFDFLLRDIFGLQKTQKMK